jgi:hypothetical protein
MGKYSCPVCGSEVYEEFRTLHEDAEQWLINRIKRQHPDWVSADGACGRCIEEFRAKRGVREDS